MSTNKKVYVINGSGGVGKDTFVDFVSKNCYFKVVHISSITPVKEIAKLLGWKGGKTEKDRKFLSDLKDLLTEYNDLPMQYLRNQYKSFIKGEMYVGCKSMFIDIREPKEIQKAVDEFGAKTILVTNKNVGQITTNHADSEVYNYEYNIHINNDGSLNLLEEIAISFCEREGLL